MGRSDLTANGGIFCESNPSNPVVPGVTTLCNEGAVDPGMFSDGAIVTVIEVAEPFGFFNLSLSCEWVVWYRFPGQPTFSAIPQFPLDPADGTNGAIGLRTNSNEFGPFRFELTDEGFFAPAPTYTMGAIGENQIAFFTPLTEIGMPEAARYYTFCTEGSFQASDSVADNSDLVEIDIELVQLQLVSALPPTSSTTSSTTTSTSSTRTSTSTTTTTTMTIAAQSGGGE